MHAKRKINLDGINAAQARAIGVLPIESTPKIVFELPGTADFLCPACSRVLIQDYDAF